MRCRRSRYLQPKIKPSNTYSAMNNTLFLFFGGLNYTDGVELHLPGLAVAVSTLPVVYLDKHSRNDAICSPPFSPLRPYEDKYQSPSRVTAATGP